MATAPYGVRLLVGVTVTAVEETRKLPQTILMYPMTVASQVASIVIHLQQNIADLVNRGDEALENLFPPKDEQPEWATFDEDDDPEPSSDGERRTEGRFALYSTGEPETSDATEPEPAQTSAADATPGIATELDYESLTLAQLRARLPSLSVADLEALLAYEGATRARAPFQTLLANRITRANAK
ncbi:lipid droplet-associated protein [Mycolicibacterium sp. S2-37]|uniref:lipid droplet-associated protein n=1 Tax=Mycolicibacterium sp. S2-37 TaxID=2810297 RepID=UPI001A93EC95|nr:lipid droplet-associated protein [Mycolicibacterium sp. S2-37]MBO0679494.1 lipid droplet-associated protein [Mycolicibacterium sp. S2-37]